MSLRGIGRTSKTSPIFTIRAGRHSADDPFALMEQHYLKENGVQLERNIDHFGFLKRYIEIPTIAEFYLPVEGPQFGRFPS